MVTVSDRRDLGPDPKVDRRAHILNPRDWLDYDPFLHVGEFWFSEVGFDYEPRRGTEVLSLVVEGVLDHRDNLGNRELVAAGDLQWLTAARGVIHAERAHEKQPVHIFRILLNMPSGVKLSDPRYQVIRSADVPVHAEPGVEVRVYSGRAGDVQGPALNHVPVTFLDVRLDPERSWTHPVPEGEAGFVYVLAGVGSVCDEWIRVGQVARFEEGGPITITAGVEAPVRALLVTAPPIGEPVVAHNNFVMNTTAEIAQALRDYRRGQFGPVPED